MKVGGDVRHMMAALCPFNHDATARTSLPAFPVGQPLEYPLSRNLRTVSLKVCSLFTERACHPQTLGAGGQVYLRANIRRWYVYSAARVMTICAVRSRPLESFVLDRADQVRRKDVADRVDLDFSSLLDGTAAWWESLPVRGGCAEDACDAHAAHAVVARWDDVLARDDCVTADFAGRAAGVWCCLRSAGGFFSI